MSTIASLDRIGVGIDTARYGHRVSFLRPDRKPAAKPLTVMENRAGYQALQDRINQLHEQYPTAHFHVHIDAAGQYAVNLELFLRGLKLPMTISVGEPKRNKDYLTVTDFGGGAVFAGFHKVPRFRCRSRNSLWPSKLSAPIFRQPTSVQQSLLPFPRP